MAAHGDGEAADNGGFSDIRHVGGRKFDNGEETSCLGGGDDFVFGGGGVGGDDENSDGETVARGEARGELECGEKMAHSGAGNKSNMSCGFHGQRKN